MRLSLRLYSKSWKYITDLQLTAKEDDKHDFNVMMEMNFISKVIMLDINNFKFYQVTHLYTCQTLPEPCFEFN